MSPLQKTGVELVADNERGFTGAMENATKSVDGFGKQASKATGGFDPMTTALGAATGGVGTLSIGALALGTALGGILLQGVQSITSGIMNFVSSGIQAVEAIQDLQINLETLAAKEILYSGVTDDMTTALDMAKPVAADLLKRLEDLSIISPFRYQQIAEVFQMNMAFGQTAEMSMELTRAITNLGAVNKGIPGILQRLSYNFSQMSMVGQITARDVRDLAMAGLDLKKVLQLQLGKTLQETNDAMKSGEITFKDVSKALVDYVDKYIGPAAERASRTLGGLKSTFADIGFFASANLLKPAAENVTVALGAMLDVVLRLVNSQAFKMLGAALEGLTMPFKWFGDWLTSVTQVTEPASLAVDELHKNIKNLGGPLKDPTPMDNFLANMANMAQTMIDYGFEALSWGINIVSQLAIGIINAGATVLITAMNFIGDMLASWLSPGSPPKVAPDLDKWGMGAMREYLLGFVEADFSVLEGIQKPLQTALSYAVEAGKMTGEESSVLFSELSRDLITAIANGKEFGEVLATSGDIFGRMVEAAGPFGNEVSNIVKSQFALASATDAAKKAQEKLTQAQKDYQSAGVKTNQQIREYNKMLREGASKDMLKAKLAQVNASRQEQVVAARGINTAQEELQTASENASALQQTLALQEKMLNVMAELAKGTITTPEPAAAEAAAKAAKGGGKGAGAIGTPEIPIPTAPTTDIKTAMEKKLDELKTAIAAKMKEAFAPLTEVFNTMKARWAEITTASQPFIEKLALLKPKMEELKATFSEAWENIKQSFSLAIEIIKPSWDQLMLTLGLGEVNVKKIFDFIWQVIVSTVELIGGAIGGFIGIVAALVKAFIDMYLVLSEHTKMAQEMLLTIWNAIVQFFTGIWQILVGIFTLNLDLIWTGIKNTFEGILTTIITIMALVANTFVMQLEAIITFVSSFVTGVIDFFTGLAKDLVGGSIIPDMLADIVTAFTNKLTEVVTLVGEKIGEVLSTVVGYVQDFVQAGSDIIGGIIDGVTGGAQRLMDAVSGAVKNAYEAALDFLGIKSPSKLMMEVGMNVTKGFNEGIAQEAQSSRSQAAVDDMTRGVVNPPRRGAAMAAGGVSNAVTVQFGNVTITNSAEGDMFEARVERAVRNALGAGI